MQHDLSTEPGTFSYYIAEESKKNPKFLNPRKVTEEQLIEFVKNSKNFMFINPKTQKQEKSHISDAYINKFLENMKTKRTMFDKVNYIFSAMQVGAGNKTISNYEKIVDSIVKESSV